MRWKIDGAGNVLSFLTKLAANGFVAGDIYNCVKIRKTSSVSNNREIKIRELCWK